MASTSPVRQSITTADPELMPSRRAAYSCNPTSIVNRWLCPGVPGRVASVAISRPRAVTSLRLAPGVPRRSGSNVFSSPSLPSLKPGTTSSASWLTLYCSAVGAPT